MPTYEYECKQCGHVFEEFQRITAEPLTKCPKCSGRIVRLPGAGAGIIFKGSGFYATDYRSDSYRRGQRIESPKHADKGAHAEKQAPEGTKPAETRDSREGRRSGKR